MQKTVKKCPNINRMNLKQQQQEIYLQRNNSDTKYESQRLEQAEEIGNQSK